MLQMPRIGAEASGVHRDTYRCEDIYLVLIAGDEDLISMSQESIWWHIERLLLRALREYLHVKTGDSRSCTSLSI